MIELIGAISGFVVFEQTGHVPESFPKSEFYPYVEQLADRLRGEQVGYVLPRFGRIFVYSVMPLAFATLYTAP